MVLTACFACLGDIGRDLEDAIRNVTAAKSMAGEDGGTYIF